MTTRQTALITGASSGIGKAIALELARRGKYDLVLTARREKHLEEVAAEAAQLGSSLKIEVVAGDLSGFEQRRDLLERLDRLGRDFSLIVNNAGFGTVEELEHTELRRQHEMVEVNCLAPLHLTHHFLPRLKARGSGCILNVASTAAFQPIPFMATYAATKSFVLSFSVAVAEEVRSAGVRVLCVCPGPTESEFHLVSGLKAKMTHLPGMTAEAVAKLAADGVERGWTLLVTGRLNAFLAFVSRHLPLLLTSRLCRRILRRDAERAASGK